MFHHLPHLSSNLRNLRKKASPSRQRRYARRAAAARKTSISETINLNCKNNAAGDDVNLVNVDQCESCLDFSDMEMGAEKVLNCGENTSNEDCSSNVINETKNVAKSIDEDTTKLMVFHSYH